MARYRGTGKSGVYVQNATYVELRMCGGTVTVFLAKHSLCAAKLIQIIEPVDCRRFMMLEPD
jgi:hypothetical protein